MEKKDFEEVLNDLEKNKKQPTVEECQNFEENWITYAKQTNFSRDAQEILLNSFKKFNSSKILYNYLCNEVNRVNILKLFLENESNKLDKTSFAKVLFGLIALMITSKTIDSDTVGRFFYESINLIKNNKEYKKSAYRYLAKFFISNIPDNPIYLNFDDFGLVVYSSSSLIQTCLEFINEIEKNEIKINEDGLNKLNSFKTWLYNSKKQIGNHIVEASAEEKKKIEEEKAKKEAEKKELERTIDIKKTEEYLHLLSQKEDIDKELAGAKIKISNLENKICALNLDIKKLNGAINDKDNQIDFLNKKITEQREITSIVEKDEAQKVKETFQQIANKLNYDYSTFIEAKNEEMSSDLCELFKDQLSNIFNVLKKVGINLE